MTATSLKWERGNKKEFEGSDTRERSHLGSATCFCQNIIHIADNIEIYTIRFNSQTLTGAIHQPFQAAACKCLVCICHLCHTDFVHLGFLTQKVLFRRGGKNGFKELLLNMGNSFGRGEEVRSELSFRSNFEKSQHRQKLVQNGSSFASQQGFVLSMLLTF